MKPFQRNRTVTISVFDLQTYLWSIFISKAKLQTSKKMWSLLLTFLTLLLPLNGIAATVKVGLYLYLYSHSHLYLCLYLYFSLICICICMQAVHKGRAPLKGAACDFIFLARLLLSSNHPIIIIQSSKHQMTHRLWSNHPIIKSSKDPKVYDQIHNMLENFEFYKINVGTREN